jgi:hypothetical protein
MAAATGISAPSSTITGAARRHDPQHHRGEDAEREGDRRRQEPEGRTRDREDHDPRRNGRLPPVGQPQGASGEGHAAELAGEGGQALRRPLHEQHVAVAQRRRAQPRHRPLALPRDGEEVDAVAAAQADVARRAAGQVGTGQHDQLTEDDLVGGRRRFLVRRGVLFLRRGGARRRPIRNRGGGRVIGSVGGLPLLLRFRFRFFLLLFLLADGLLQPHAEVGED